jgi:hypothetical protein
VHPSWPHSDLCRHAAIQFRDFAFADPYGWVGQLGSGAGAYNGSFYVHMTNGAALCPEPLRTCGGNQVVTVSMS